MVAVLEMKTLVITDLHLNSRVPGLLEAQAECVLKIFFSEWRGHDSHQGVNEVIIMGDVFMYRKPSPSELLAFKGIIDKMKERCNVVILRGNHDSETKADDGKTALLLYEDEWSWGTVKVVTHTYTDKHRKRVYIPHYENEETIINALEMVPEGYSVFGHFGYAGCLNSAGDADFGISLSNFTAPTYLGHIHRFREGQGGLPEACSRVVCLGTPYTTNYGEAFKDNFYALLDDEITEFKKVATGPRHLVYAAKDVEDNLETINDPNYFTFLRVLRGPDHHPIPYEKLSVAYLDIKYAPVFDEEELSTYTPERELFSINEMIISDYVEDSNSIIPSQVLMEGYRLLRDENC
jgi:hypothetical protein